MNESLADVPVLRLLDVWRTYAVGDGALEVLKGVDLDVYGGEIIGLIGPSGSGKSSLLHAAGLLEHPTRGRVVVAGQDCSALQDRKRSRVRLETIGFVYQFHHLLAEFTALDNVALPLMIAGEGETSARARAADLLTALGLAQRLKHQPAQMSGGEQQRVAIARALANRPRLILADEPTGNLDPTTSGAVFKNLFDLARGEGAAVLVATHNMELAGFMDRVYALKDGHLVERAPVV